MEDYNLTPVRNLLDAFSLRNIRNECRLYMTNDTSKIGLLRQIDWYLNYYKTKNKKDEIFCYLLRGKGKNVGFGLIRKADGKYWISGGLSEKERGKGLGSLLFKELIKHVKSPSVWLEVLDSNIAAQKIYRKLNFKLVKKTKINEKNILVMCLKK